jgi:dTDP-4-amino-4,6-dideoxygalactose transaminase
VNQDLALAGGPPVVDFAWPVWPKPRDQARELVIRTLDSGRWTLSGPWAGRRSQEQTFAAEFAEYNGVDHCVPVASGTSALVVGLEGLGVGAGDEVLVPGLTWIASATAVLNVNAVPVLVDIDPETLCVSPDALEAAITPRTRAITVVHLYNSMADMDRILDIARRYDLPVLEDCAQAHGAKWDGKRAGTMGVLGTFSMQETKLLTAGEGGAVITDDAELADRLFQLRADGRRLASTTPGLNEMELVENSSIMGNNYCLSELSAAVLLDQLEFLDADNDVRAAHAIALNAALAPIPGVSPVLPAAKVTGPTYYHYAVRCDRTEFANRPLATIARALQAELRYPVDLAYAPLNDNVLYRPHTKRRYHLSDEHLRRIDPVQHKLPEAHRAYGEILTLHHPFLLADDNQVSAVAAAFDKVRRSASRLPDN